jgi:hypothetical protein
MWALPSKDTWECLTVENADFEEFITGYQQMVFKTLDKDVDCVEVVDLVRNDGSGTDTVTINVARGHCPVVECDDLTIVDLDPKSCECKPLEETKGTLFDSRFVLADQRFVRLDKFEQFTIREFAVTAGEWQWSMLDAATLECVDEVKDFTDQYNRYRQKSFESVKDDCRGDFIQTATAVDDDATLAFQVVVWPERLPAIEGDLVDLDTTAAFEIYTIGQSKFTLRMAEQTTPTGFAFDTPDVATAFDCVTLDNTNFGDFNTGYQQWVFTAIDLDCNENIVLKRSSNWAADAGAEVQFFVNITKKACELIDCPAG